MADSYKPEGYNSLAPYLIVEEAQRMIAWLAHVFDGQVTRRFDNDDGSIMHAEVKIDDSIVMLSDATEQFQPVTHLLHVYVPDALETYGRAVESGCKPLDAPREREDDPDLRGSFQDYAGNTWFIATQR